MIKFSEATAIALHSMIYITNREDDSVSLKEIAKRFKISENHLSKVLQRLVKAGYLVSSKGPKGGFKIVKEKKSATFLEIYEIIEGKVSQQTCLFSSEIAECRQCIMGNLIPNLNKEFTDYMQKHKITDFSI